MEILKIQLLAPKAKQLLQDLADLKLMSISSSSAKSKEKFLLLKSKNIAHINASRTSSKILGLYLPNTVFSSICLDIIKYCENSKNSANFARLSFFTISYFACEISRNL